MKEEEVKLTPVQFVAFGLLWIVLLVLLVGELFFIRVPMP